MKKMFTTKRVVLLGLFILPLVFFLFLSTGINNFNKLPTIKSNIYFSQDRLNKVLPNKVSVLVFPGDNIESSKTGVLNINEKIYKKFYDYRFFQMVMIYPDFQKENIEKLKTQLATFSDMQKWRFIPMNNEEIEKVLKQLDSELVTTSQYSSKAFIIDKDNNLRGRTDDEDIEGGKLFAYDMNSVSELKDKMTDDIKVLLYEYRAAFKNKNRAKRVNN